MCETNIDDCVENECKNGSKCVDGVNAYTCDCAPGYRGRFCDEKFEWCSSAALNPCANDAICIPANSNVPDYICECKSGWTGRNCSENANDCDGHLCQNGAKCVDGLNTYSCQCANGFSGQFCEQASQMPEIEQLAKTSPCQQSDCVHGVCFQPNSNSTEYYCKCSTGYMGKRCDILSSISFHSGKAYLQFDPLDSETAGDLNVTLDLATSGEFGILLYAGQNKRLRSIEEGRSFGQHLNQHHLAVELYQGRVRVSLNLANHSTATMFSYELVNDGVYHEIQMRLKGNTFTMRVDGGKMRSIKSEAISDVLLMGAPLFIGGLSTNFSSFAVKHRHVWNKHSFMGCMRALQMNGQLLDIQMATGQQRVAPGCVQFSNSNTAPDQMDGVRLMSSATSMAVVSALRPAANDPQLNDEQAMVQELIGNETDLKVQRKTHYLHHNHTKAGSKHHKAKEDSSSSSSSSSAEKSSVQTSAPQMIGKQAATPECTRKYFTDFYRENDCVSTRKLRMAKCGTGSCSALVDSVSQPGCCKATRHRSKQVRMKCEDGRTIVKKLAIVRKCSCSTKSCY